MGTTTASMGRQRARRVTGSVLERCLAKIRYDSGCWTWTAHTSTGGYARIMGANGPVVAHVAVYEALVGPVPDGLLLDHLCRNRSCCNPLHLEPVTFAENVRRGAVSQVQRSKTHCPSGHAYTPENTQIKQPGDRRGCRECSRIYTREYRAARKAATP